MVAQCDNSLKNLRVPSVYMLGKADTEHHYNCGVYNDVWMCGWHQLSTTTSVPFHENCLCFAEKRFIVLHLYFVMLSFPKQ